MVVPAYAIEPTAVPAAFWVMNAVCETSEPTARMIMPYWSAGLFWLQ